jgi:hypothetical protein
MQAACRAVHKSEAVISPAVLSKGHPSCAHSFYGDTRVSPRPTSREDLEWRLMQAASSPDDRREATWRDKLAVLLSHQPLER